MKPSKWRDLSDEELRQRVKELTEELFNLRFQLSMGVAKNPARVAEARRDLARAKTILRERGLGLARGAGQGGGRGGDGRPGEGAAGGTGRRKTAWGASSACPATGATSGSSPARRSSGRTTRPTRAAWGTGC